MAFLIAEISNHHQGSIDKAKELIRIAKECGADAVKGQAFRAEDILSLGSMPEEWYRQCQLDYYQYAELIDYGKSIDIPVFYTVISNKYVTLLRLQKFRKIHASGFLETSLSNLYRLDKENTLVSIPRMRSIKDGNVKFKKACVLYSTDYSKDIDDNFFSYLRKYLDRDIGISHNFPGVENLIDMTKEHKITCIEKHFYLGEEIKFKGKIYRDCLHSANPDDFSRLAKSYKR